MVPRLQSTALIAESDRFWQLTEGDRFIPPLATHQNVPDNELALTPIRQLAPLECGSDVPVRHTTSTASTGRLSESGSSSLVGKRNQG